MTDYELTLLTCTQLGLQFSAKEGDDTTYILVHDDNVTHGVNYTFDKDGKFKSIKFWSEA